MISRKQLDIWFTYHPPTVQVPDPDNPGGTKSAPDQEKIAAYRKVRDAGHALALVILDVAPACPDQSSAIRKVREAVAVCNMAIACAG